MALTQPGNTPPALTGFKFPQEYSFPPFFTRQPNITTRHAQQRTWSALVLAYARHHRLFRLRLSEAAETELFYNHALERRLQPVDIRELIDSMAKEGRAEYITASSSSSGVGMTSSFADGGHDVIFIYWKKPEEWAAIVEQYVEDTAQKGSVLTVYELSQGDGTRSTDLHGIDSEVLLKALNILVKRGKAQIFGQEDSLGVKFF